MPPSALHGSPGPATRRGRTSSIPVSVDGAVRARFPGGPHDHVPTGRTARPGNLRLEKPETFEPAGGFHGHERNGKGSAAGGRRNRTPRLAVPEPVRKADPPPDGTPEAPAFFGGTGLHGSVSGRSRPGRCRLAAGRVAGGRNPLFYRTSDAGHARLVRNGSRGVGLPGGLVATPELARVRGLGRTFMGSMRSCHGSSANGKRDLDFAGGEAVVLGS